MWDGLFVDDNQELGDHLRFKKWNDELKKGICRNHP